MPLAYVCRSSRSRRTFGGTMWGLINSKTIIDLDSVMNFPFLIVLNPRPKII